MALRPARALPFLLYALIIVPSFYPQALRPWDTVAYAGDSLESAYIVAWNAHALQCAPERIFQSNILHPHKNALAFTDHRILPSLAVAPVFWLTGNAVLAYNVSLALATLLAAFAARHLARVLGCRPIGAWAAGALYAFHTYQVNEAPRLNIVFHGFIPLALAQLVLLLRTGKPRHAWLLSGLVWLQGLSSLYHLVYACLVLALILLGAFLASPGAVLRRTLHLVPAALVSGVLLFPVAYPYLEAAGLHGFRRELPSGVDLSHYVSTSPTNLLYGPLGATVRRQQQGPHFVGFLSLALAGTALAAVLLGRGERGPGPLPARAWVPCAGALALTLVALSLGRDMAVGGSVLGPGPYRLLYAFVPGLQLVRIPERLSLLAMLFVALLVARGLSLVERRWRIVAALLALMVPLEHVSPLPVPYRVPVGDQVPEVYRFLARHPAGAVAEVPIRGEGLVREETVEMYFSTVHFRPIIHGYTAYPPLLTRLLRRFAARFPSEASLEAFRRVGVDTIVVHHGRPLGLDLRQRIAATPGPQDPDERFERLLRQAGLDLYARLPAAVSSRRLALEARFEGEEAHLFQSTADEVYRLQPLGTRVAAAPFPQGRRARGDDWRYRAKLGNPELAADGDLLTAWTVPAPLRGDEFFEVHFADALPVSGLVLTLTRESRFPTRFRVAGRDRKGNWSEVARFDDAHALQLLESVQRDPRGASLGFALGERELTVIRLLVAEEGTSFDGWWLPEVEVLVPW